MIKVFLVGNKKITQYSTILKYKATWQLPSRFYLSKSLHGGAFGSKTYVYPKDNFGHIYKVI